jgi:hypothetical protein
MQILNNKGNTITGNTISMAGQSLFAGIQFINPTGPNAVSGNTINKGTAGIPIAVCVSGNCTNAQTTPSPYAVLGANAVY